MESFRGLRFGMGTNVATRRRSTIPRRPRTEPHLLMEALDVSTSPTTPSSEYLRKQSPESGSNDSSNQRKTFSLNTTNLKTSSINKLGGVALSSKSRKDEKLGCQSERGGRHKADLKRCSEGASASSSKIKSGDLKENREALSRTQDNQTGYGSSVGNATKVKLKVGGVTHTLHAKSSAEGISAAAAATTKPPRTSDASRNRNKLNLQVSEGGNNNSRLAKEASCGKSAEDTFAAKHNESSEPVRKSKRIPKKRVLDGAFGEEDGDDELRYLERLKISKLSNQNFVDQEVNIGDDFKNRRSSKNSKYRRTSYDEDLDFGLSQRSKDGRKRSKSDIESEDCAEEEEQTSDAGPENMRRKQECSSDTADEKKLSLTTRQRAIQSSKDGAGGTGATYIEFPNGLPPAPPRKQKGKLSEVEQQLKKAEAAKRRRMQVEKAARESEAEAIRKILGQDSSRKKREDKLRKKREELAQGRALNSVLPPSHVRWVLGPSGTTVVFPVGADLPSIFNATPCRYPPPREKCAGPSCTNAYKYRDSKSNLPLCSLQCYRAVQQNHQVATC